MRTRKQQTQQQTRSLAAVYVGLAALLALLPQAGAVDKSSAKSTEPKLRVDAKSTATKRAELFRLEKEVRKAEDRKRARTLLLTEPYLLADAIVVEDLGFRSSIRSYPGYYTPTETTVAQGDIVVDSSKAGLKTNPEHERKLVRAEEFAKKGRTDLAVVLWQTVLNESTDTVMTRDEWQYTARERTYQKYRSVADEVERMIAKLPAEGLKMYRLRADGEAKSLIAATLPERREEALSAVVRKYFLSTFGDDAAFELACRQLDRGEFLGASQLLAKILHDYPDTNIPKEELRLRLAVAQARMGDRKAALAALQPLKVDPPRGSTRLLQMLERDIQSATGSPALVTNGNRSWPMALGNAARNAYMKSPSTLAKGANLTELWSRELGLGFAVSSRKSRVSGRGPSVSVTTSRPALPGGFRSSGVVLDTRSYASPSYPGQPVQQVTSATSHEELINRWTKNGWTPAGQILIDGKRIYLKFRYELICLDAETNEILWRSLWKNRFTPDSTTTQFGQMNLLRRTGQPQEHLDVQLFGDLVHQSMSLSGDLVFNIEGPRFDEVGGILDKPPEAKAPVVHHWGTPQIMRRTRTNSLTAYEAKTGKLKWHRPAGGKEGNVKADVGFLAAPVPYARLLLAPITDGGEIWLLAMDRDTGETVWKTSLCDEPSGGCSPWSPVGVSIDGGEAYVATGSGVIFAVDAMNGGIRWAFRYPRTGRKNPYIQQRFGYGGATSAMLDLEGMVEDVVIPRGKALVVMPSDYNRIFAIDRRTGEFLWDSPMQGTDSSPAVSYCVGTHNNALFVAGRRTIRRYSLSGGKLEWEKTLKESDVSLGRGIVTDYALYLPVKDSVLKLSLEDGKELEQMGVVLEDREPVGNLYSDGERLFSLGPGRLSALGDIKNRVKELDGRVSSGDTNARLERMELRARLRDFAGAIEDLRVLFDARAKTDPVSAFHFHIGSITKLELAPNDPLTTVSLLSQSDRLLTKDIEAKSTIAESLQERDLLLRTVLEKLKEEKPAGGAAAVLSAAAMCRQDFLVEIARDTIRQIVTVKDREILAKSVTAENAQQRRLAVAGLTKIADAESLKAIKQALADSDENLRIDSAVALANHGDRDGLPVLVDLLSSTQLATRVRSSSLLKRMTGKSFGFLAYGMTDSRDAAVKQWKQWLATEAKSAALRPVTDQQPILGRTLIAFQNSNYVEEYDSRHQMTKRLTVSSPTAVAGTPNGHRFVASYRMSQIVEYDKDWKSVRTINTSKWGRPYGVSWLESGNVLISCFNTSSSSYEGNVLEYDPNGKIVWRFSYTGQPSTAQRLSNGNTLICFRYTYTTSGLSSSTFGSRRVLRRTTLGKVLEVDPNRKVVKEYRQIQYPQSAQRLENGKTLITDMNSNRVVEILNDDRMTTYQSGSGSPRNAQRLPNGHTVVTHASGITEYNREGKQAWYFPRSGIVDACRY